MKSQLAATVALMVLATGCATTAPRSEFDDVPLPRGLTYQPQRSVVIESPSVKAAELVYRGRLEPESLALAMRTLLESNGWRHVNTTTAAKDGTRQAYEKGGNALGLHIYEGLWFTYLTIGVSRTLLQAANQVENDTPRASAGTVVNPDKVTSSTTAGVDASVSAQPGPQTPPAADRTTRSSEPSFVQRLKDFFIDLFPR
jgi:hypothetical protein